MDEISEKLKPENKVEDCPFCKEGKINVTFIPSYISWSVSRIAAGSKRTKFIHDPRTIVHSKCPKCGKSKQEIKDALEGIGHRISYEERLKRMQSQGLPTKLEFHLTS